MVFLFSVLTKQNTSDTRCVVSPHMPSNSPVNISWVSYKFNSVLTLSAWRWHQILPAKGSVPWDCSHLRCQLPAPGYGLCFWLDGYKSDFLKILSSCLINLLGQLREMFTFTSLLLRLLWRKQMSNHKEEMHRAQIPSRNLSMWSSLNPVLLDLMEAPLGRCDYFNHWPLVPLCPKVNFTLMNLDLCL